MIFSDYTVACGEIMSQRQHETRVIEKRAKDYFRDMLRDRHDSEEVHFLPPIQNFSLKVAVRGETAMATFYHRGIPATLSLIMTGRTPHQDRMCMMALAGTLRACDPTVASHEYLKIDTRPVLITLILAGATVIHPAMLAMIADMETCLAASLLEDFALQPQETAR